MMQAFIASEEGFMAQLAEPRDDAVVPPDPDGVDVSDSEGGVDGPDSGVEAPESTGVFAESPDGIEAMPDERRVAGSVPKAGPRRIPGKASSSQAREDHDRQPAGADAEAWEYLDDLQAERDAATALGMRWQDRGPVPADPQTETWRSQRWRARTTTTDDASVGRWGKREGNHRIWYTTFYGLKGAKGLQAATQAADEAVGKGKGKGQR